MSALPQAPGAQFIQTPDLSLDDLIDLITSGPVSAVTSLRVLQAFLLAPFVLPSRVVTSNAAAAFAATDVMLLIDKTVASATSITLPTPTLGRMIGIKDMAGNAGTYNITLDAGAGKLVNGLQTLVMDGDWGTTLLVGMSDTQWGTLI